MDIQVTHRFAFGVTSNAWLASKSLTTALPVIKLVHTNLGFIITTLLDTTPVKILALQATLPTILPKLVTSVTLFAQPA
jgi:hypothetical protein